MTNEKVVEVIEANFELVQAEPIEVNFEVNPDEEPITIDLELKQYFDGEGQKFKDIYFDDLDWVLDNDGEYQYRIGKDIHGMLNFGILEVMLWDEDTEIYKPSLADYHIFENKETKEKSIILFSEYPCKGMLKIFGQVG